LDEQLVSPQRDEPQLAPPVSIAVIGPEDLVDHVMTVSASSTTAARLVGAPYQREDDAVRVVRRVQDEVDALLFTGPAPYDLAYAADAVDVPASYIPLNGETLYRALLTARLADGPDLRNLSIDTLARDEVDEVYRELGLPTEQLHLRPYQKGEDAGRVATWHADLLERGVATAALTCRRTIHRELAGRGLPVWRVIPTHQSIVTSVTTATLLGSGRRAERSRLALCLVELVRFEATARQSASPHWMHETRLALHRTLLEEAQRLGGTVVPLATGQFLVITTLGALRLVTDGFAVAPFVDAVDHALGQRVSVGIGAASTAHDAEAAAYSALDDAREAGGDCAYLRGDDASMHRLERRRTGSSANPDELEPSARDRTATRDRKLHELARLHEALDAETPPDQSPTVEANTAATSLGISLRSARRLLRSLVAEGLAWPVTSEAATRGRPRHRYRLAPMEQPEGTDD
jgi:hypothetical protein